MYIKVNNHSFFKKYVTLGGCGGPERTECVLGLERNCLSPLATDTAGKLDVLGHDCDTFGVDGAQVRVLEETDQVSLRSLLEGHDS